MAPNVILKCAEKGLDMVQLTIFYYRIIKNVRLALHSHMPSFATTIYSELFMILNHFCLM